MPRGAIKFNYMEQIGLGQLDSLRDVLNTPKLQDHLGIFDISYEAFNKAMAGKTQKQYKYLLFLLFNKDWFKLKKLMTQFGFVYKK